MPASISAPDAVLPPGEEPSLVALAGQAIDEGKALVGAEVALAKAKLKERVTAYRGAVMMFAAAAILAFAAMIALLVGLILTLAPLIGPGGATAVVVGVVFVIAGVLGFVGKTRLAPPELKEAA